MKLPKNIEKVIPHQLKKVSFKDRKNLPEESGIYFVIQNEEIIYVGKATYLKARWIGNGHKVTKYIKEKKIENEVNIHYLLKRSFLDDVEWFFICKYLPKLNLRKPDFAYEQIENDIYEDDILTLDVQVIKSQIISIN